VLDPSPPKWCLPKALWGKRKKDPRLPCFCMGTRQRLSYFIGRDDIMKLMDNTLQPPPASPNSDQDEVGYFAGSHLRSFAICGFGGMGKTILAAEYAYSRRDKFEAIFWLRADDVTILASNFAQIAQRLGLEDESSDLAASRDIAMGWLAQPLKKTSDPDAPGNVANWLIVFDNVDNLEVLADFFPKLGRGSVLVTSRDPFAKQNFHVENGIDLPRLSDTTRWRTASGGSLERSKRTVAALPLADSILQRHVVRRAAFRCHPLDTPLPSRLSCNMGSANIPRMWALFLL
jgi:hypothetical protein